MEMDLDPPVCRLQFPDGSVPGNVREAAEGWKRWADARGALIAKFLTILTHKQISPPMSDGIQDNLIVECRAALTSNQELPTDELTERFYAVRGQRNKLLWACQKALAAYDSANELGRGSWSWEVDKMRAAVADCEAK